MFCSHCGAQVAPNASFCPACGNRIDAAAAGPVSLDKPAAPVPPAGEDPPAGSPPGNQDRIPDGVKGWSWGAFLLNWVWAIGNRSWIGLLALVPYLGWIVVFWLGFKGREMAWKNRRWDSLEHFNRVQRKWSQWGIGITAAAFVLAVLAALTLPAYQEAALRGQAAQGARPAEDAGAARERQYGPVTARGGIDVNAGAPEPLSTVAGTLERRAGADGRRAVTLDGEVLFRGEDANWQFPLRKFALSDGKEAILMASSGGRGSSCETLFYFLLADARGVTPTPMFGTCASRGRYEQRGDAIVVELPDMHGPSTIVLTDGAVVANGQRVTLNDMNDPSK